MARVSLSYLDRKCRSKKKRIRKKWAARKLLAEERYHKAALAISKTIRETYGSPQFVEKLKEMVYKPDPLLEYLKKTAIDENHIQPELDRVPPEGTA